MLEGLDVVMDVPLRPDKGIPKNPDDWKDMNLIYLKIPERVLHFRFSGYSSFIESQFNSGASEIEKSIYQSIKDIIE